MKPFRGKPAVAKVIVDDLRSLAQIEKIDELELAALEQAVELKPMDWQLRFSLAYKHSECGNLDMAFFHYSKIPVHLRDSTAWNNIGVSFSNFEMPMKSTSAFRSAEELGETLAMSNLGFRLLRAGFVKEATELANKAIQLGNYHANITDLLKRLKEVPGDEDKKETEALDKVKPKAAFYRRFGNAALMETPTEIGDKWSGPETVFNASLEDGDVRIVGSFEADDNPFAAFVDGLVRRKVTRRIEYTLKLSVCPKSS